MDKQNGRLQELWKQRSQFQLNQAEWEELYQLIYCVLAGVNNKKERYPELKQLPESYETYINDYFINKVYRMDDNPLYFDNAIRTFFQRYLQDILKNADARFWRGIQSVEPAVYENFPSSEKNAIQSALEQEIKPSAQKFLQENEEWVLLYLAHHTCLEKGQPLSQLEKIYQIPNYHHKARQLGITRKKGQFEKGYEKTLLGQWLLSLNLSLEKENFTYIEVALKILCNEALLLIENY